MQKITPFLWFDNQAEEAANLYVSLFPNSRIKNSNRYTEEGAEVSGQSAGSVMAVSFELDGQEFSAINGGPMFKFTEAVSFVVSCKDQAEVDHFWNGLTAEGGAESQCGWLKDKFGLSWQIIPEQMNKMMSDPDPVKAGRVMAAMLKMKKIDIAKLEEAYNQA
ncbi:MAG: 3-demethylubiquinone-9 3-methyltransferase family protein [Parcubacteria group bacterium]|nr:3-demethylubiquinone-9 3-methyltransferase family protein [Parcubacteria group bacterium]